MLDETGKSDCRQKLTLREVIFLVDYILSRLAEMEADHPYLKTLDYAQYQNLKSNLQREYSNPADSKGFILGIIYGELRTCLEQIDAERAKITSISKKRPKKTKLQDYLPVTFEDLITNFKKSSKSEYMQDAINSAAEAIVMDELEGGLRRIVPTLREEVKRKILEVLVYDHGERKRIETTMQMFGIDKIPDFLGQDDMELQVLADWNSILEDNDQTEGIKKNMAQIIIQARDQIDYEYGESVRGSKPRPTTKDITKTTALLCALEAAKREAIKSGREQRLELAERICLPKDQMRVRNSLRLVPSVQE